MRTLWEWTLIVCALAGCSSSGVGGAGGTTTGGTTMTQANACATRGATYLTECRWESGDCPMPSSQVINISSDGKTGESQTCELAEQNGCTSRGTNCTRIMHGCTTNVTYQTTFVSDGSSAESLQTVSAQCSDGSSCAGTFVCTFTRQGGEGGSGGGSGGGGSPIDNGTPCGNCLVEQCEAELDLCVESPACNAVLQCFADCAAAGGDATCGDACRAQYPAAESKLLKLAFCMKAQCAECS